MNENRELRVNASGYYDEPCYKAVTGAPKPGEIWQHATSGSYMLVLARKNGVNTCVRLIDAARDENCLPVMCRAQMYVNPSFLGYCFDGVLGAFVKVAAKSDVDAVREAVVTLMGYETGSEGDDAAVEGAIELEERLQELETELAKAKHELSCARSCNDMLQSELDKSGAQAEKVAFYKEMYMTMLDKVMAMAVKA